MSVPEHVIGAVATSQRVFSPITVLGSAHSAVGTAEVIGDGIKSPKELTGHLSGMTHEANPPIILQALPASQSLKK